MKLSILTRAPHTRRLLPFVGAALAVAAIAPGLLSAADAKKPPPPAKGAGAGAGALTLAASNLQAVYGSTMIPPGTISSKQAGENVPILAQRYGDAKPATLTTVATTAGGAWSYATKPTIGTSYQGQCK